MKKIVTIFTVLLLFAVAGCKGTDESNDVIVTKRYELDDVFSNYDSKEPVLMLLGESIKLSDYIKETELSYSYVLKGSDDTLISSDDAKITDTITLDNKGNYVLSISVNDRDDLSMTSYLKVDSLEDVLSNRDKDADINALLEKYGASLSSDIDTSKPGVYSVEVKRNDDTVEYVTAVVAKDEINNNVVTESKPSVSVKEDTSKASSSSSLDKSDERIALAYEYEGRGGLCGQIAYNYLKDLGYLNNFTYEDFLMYQVLDKFEHINDPVPFKTLIEYDNGNHVAVYLGNNMALHGNYTGDYANGNGKAKVASMYISGMSITSYKNMDVTNNATQEELVKEAIGSNGNSTATPPANNNTVSNDSNDRYLENAIKECEEINADGWATCWIDENGMQHIDTGVPTLDEPLNENSYDPELCRRKFSEIDDMTDNGYLQLNEFCAIYYPDYVDWDN